MSEEKKRLDFEGICPFLSCMEEGPHSHGICPQCGAVYTCQESEEGGHDRFYHPIVN
jgi:hypothetical protein